MTLWTVRRAFPEAGKRPHHQKTGLEAAHLPEPSDTQNTQEAITVPVVPEGGSDYGDTDYGPDSDGATDYSDTDYGPGSDGDTAYTPSAQSGNASSYDDGSSSYSSSDYDSDEDSESGSDYEEDDDDDEDDDD